MNNDDVTLKVNGVAYKGWKSVRIDVGLEQIARAFALSVTDNFPGNINFTRFRTGDVVEVFIGSDLVCTGYITAVPIKYDAKKITVEVQGKSKTVDLVDCCPPSAAYEASNASSGWSEVKGSQQSSKQVFPKTSWNNQPIQKILEDLCEPYGIKVGANPDISNTLKNHTVNPGEKVIDSINRLLTKLNLIVTDDEYGNLIVRESFKEVAHDRLIFGQNILSAETKYDASQLYSNYITLGQHKGNDDNFSSEVSEDFGQYRDTDVSRYRLLVLKDNGQSTNNLCKSRSEFEARYRRAKFKTITYLVQGWRQSNLQLWRAGLNVAVEDDTVQISERMIITKVTYSISSSGMVTTLMVAPPDILGNKNTEKVSVKTSNSWANVS